ncbi:MAG: thiol peroxidase [Polyangiales bacterium]
MASITLKGNVVHTNGDLPDLNDDAPKFLLVASDLSEKTLEDFAGKRKVLTINPSYDTGTCQITVRNFNKRASELDNTVVLMISHDLPFAQKRFCEAEGIDAVLPLSSFRSSFARDYGVEITDGPLRGLTARAIVVLDENDQVVYHELVAEIVNEPDYDAALNALS